MATPPPRSRARRTCWRPRPRRRSSSGRSTAATVRPAPADPAVRAEQVTDPVAHHAEGPVWSPSWGGLRWVDMLAGDVLSLNSDGTIHRQHVEAVVAAIRPRRSGG